MKGKSLSLIVTAFTLALSANVTVAQSSGTSTSSPTEINLSPEGLKILCERFPLNSRCPNGQPLTPNSSDSTTIPETQPSENTPAPDSTIVPTDPSTPDSTTVPDSTNPTTTTPAPGSITTPEMNLDSTTPAPDSITTPDSGIPGSTTTPEMNLDSTTPAPDSITTPDSGSTPDNTINPGSTSPSR